MKLYEIDKALMEAFEKAIDPDTGEIVDEEAYNDFCQLEMDREKKIENVGLWIKDLKAESEALKTEADKLLSRKMVADNEIERLKDFLSRVLNGEKFKTARLSVSYRWTESVSVCVPVLELPPDMIRWKNPEPDKKAIKEAIKNGMQIEGCKLEEKQSIQIR